MSAAPQLQDERERIYSLLTSDTVNTPNHKWLACMIASWCVGRGALPDYLGLEPAQFNAVTARFQGCPIPRQAVSGQQLDFSRMLEKDDLVKLLQQFAATQSADTDIIIAIIVAGCLGSDHLWQDLGLWSRAQLSAMLQYNFPALAAKNDKDMKWKKFLYKQLCEMEGLYLCRAPSCDVCIDYPNCYGKES
ncbi:MAG: nitrogen fixation protein NifQ [Methylovulum sp.]|nr:nitrogen fixation protein NifQ [Methylovulum sp.]